MEQLFKQNLLRMRESLPPATFSEALLGQVNWAKKSSSAPATEKLQKAPESGFTEKAQVIDSLERFAQEKLQGDESQSIKVSGGEIGLKPEPKWEGVSTFSNVDGLLNSLSLEKSTLELTLADKVPGKVKILFVSETFRPMGEFKSELKDGFINQLLPAFPLKTAELFSRMLGAMKLVEEETIIFPSMYDEKDISSEVLEVAAFFKPEIIVTLGANATHKILKGQERLAQVHGQFFNRKIENIGTFIVVPLFHPSIIENNQNMKKTAWTDMQKIMKHLKKL